MIINISCRHFRTICYLLFALYKLKDIYNQNKNMATSVDGWSGWQNYNSPVSAISFSYVPRIYSTISSMPGWTGNICIKGHDRRRSDHRMSFDSSLLLLKLKQRNITLCSSPWFPRMSETSGWNLLTSGLRNQITIYLQTAQWCSIKAYT